MSSFSHKFSCWLVGLNAVPVLSPERSHAALGAPRATDGKCNGSIAGVAMGADFLHMHSSWTATPDFRQVLHGP
jgi:hypothetical protein